MAEYEVASSIGEEKDRDLMSGVMGIENEPNERLFGDVVCGAHAVAEPVADAAVIELVAELAAVADTVEAEAEAEDAAVVRPNENESRFGECGDCADAPYCCS